MPTRHHATVTVPHPPKLGGKWAVILFVITLFAFVAESQLTQYVQTTLQYRQPFFIFYIVHSSFAIIFPMHLLYLMATSKYSASALITGLSVAVADHLSPPETETLGTSFDSSLQKFPTYRFMRLVFALTVGITCPSLLWFAAISLASISDVTALWNTSPFFVYIITVKMFHLKWEPRRMMAVSLAILGTIGVLYGGSTSTSSSGDGDIDIAANTEIEIEARTTKMAKPTAPLVGDILIVIASVGYAFYQVLYKKYAALPSDPEVASEGLYESIPASSDGLYNADETASIIITDSEMDDVPITPPPPPFGFHPNMLTSSIGLCTFIILWIPIPILHYFDLEPFRFPSNSLTVIAIAGIAFTGVIFNAGFMILLGAWGPIITSVGNLLTIVLVFFSDVLFGAGIEAVNVWGLVGSTVIVAAFAVLAYDMFRGR